MKLYRDRNMLILHQISCSFSRILLPISPLSNQKILDFRDFTSKFGNFEYFFTNTLKHLYRGCYGQKIGWKTMLAISKIIGFENSKTPHNGFKSCFEWYKFCFSGLVSSFPSPKIDRFLVVSCDVLKQCEESVTIIDGECARFAKNMYCKIFIILAYSQYRRYKYSSCTPSYILQRHGRHIYARS